MEFDWTPVTVGDWNELVKQAAQPNWMQTFSYAKASRIRDQKNTRLAQIRDGGAPIGMMALQEISLGPLHLFNLNRGPLWFSEVPKEKVLTDFTDLLNDTFPRKLFRRRRWMPEWEISEEAKSTLENGGFSALPQTYQTIWILLQKSEDELRRQLKQKWRNSLNKGLRSDLRIISDWQGQNLNLFLKLYDAHRNQKNYQGPSSLFIKEELRAALSFGDALLLWAYKDQEVVAGIYVFVHGNTASYRIGWNTQAGRSCNAHYVLLWKALEILKEKGLTAFDLGGIKPEEAEGLTHFKQGLGGQEVKLLGIYR